MMKLKLLILSVLAPTTALAAGAGGGHGDGIPLDVLFQAINFTLFTGLMAYFLAKPIKNYFESRAANYRQALVKAEAARAEAEKQKQEIANRLAALENSAQQSIVQARAEAEELRARIVRDAQDLSTKLREDAKRTADLEVQRAKVELREEVLSQAVSAAKSVLKERIAEQDQKRLQSEFVGKIQEVR